MEQKEILVTNKEENKLIKAAVLNNIKSKYIFRKIFDIITIPKKFELIKYNKTLQKKLNLDINDYKEYSKIIEIEITTDPNEIGKFINIKNEDEKYFHIYFNDNKKEENLENYYLYEDDEVSKINIIIDYQINSFNRLFEACNIIESINFKVFCRNNICDMSGMFYFCTSLKEVNL